MNEKTGKHKQVYEIDHMMTSSFGTQRLMSTKLISTLRSLIFGFAPSIILDICNYRIISPSRPQCNRRPPLNPPFQAPVPTFLCNHLRHLARAAGQGVGCQEPRFTSLTPTRFAIVSERRRIFPSGRVMSLANAGTGATGRVSDALLVVGGERQLHRSCH